MRLSSKTTRLRRARALADAAWSCLHGGFCEKEGPSGIRGLATPRMDPHAVQTARSRNLAVPEVVDGDQGSVALAETSRPSGVCEGKGEERGECEAEGGGEEHSGQLEGVMWIVLSEMMRR